MFLSVSISTLYLITFLVPCCDIRYHFHIKMMFVFTSYCLQEWSCLIYVVCDVCRSGHVLFTLFVLAYVQWCPTHIDYMSSMAYVLWDEETARPLHAPVICSGFWQVRVAHLFSFLCCFIFGFICLRLLSKQTIRSLLLSGFEDTQANTTHCSCTGKHIILSIEITTIYGCHISTGYCLLEVRFTYMGRNSVIDFFNNK